jgi:hypothetical protein
VSERRKSMSAKRGQESPEVPRLAAAAALPEVLHQFLCFTELSHQPVNLLNLGARPAAIRRRREALSMSGFVRSRGVIALIIALDTRTLF